MSVFSRLERMASSTVDRVNAERFRLAPMCPADDPNGRPVVDSSRAVVDTIGVLDLEPEAVPVEFGPRRIGRGSNDLMTVQTGRRMVLSVSADHFTDRPQQGDVVEMMDRRDFPALRIAEIRADGTGRIELVLVKGG